MMKYALDLPYPDISELETNIEYGHMILSNLGGLHSEMNAVSLYNYNHVIINKAWKELADVFFHISLVEMKHLQIFAQLCFQLGVDPRLWDCQNDFLEYWSPGYNVYPRDIRAMLENAIIQEQNTISHYQYQMSCIDNSTIQEILNHIIQEEQLHVEILTTFLQQYNHYSIGS